ncbi:MAG: hypothetical protein LBF89_08165 [Bacteroidales bacterium]|jgi:hypothetical protein|nr:hypothetical protein [Bacteroidales bacterium]
MFIFAAFQNEKPKEDGEYKMYNSWRPKGSLALSVSADGTQWSLPEIVLAPNPETSWEIGFLNIIVVDQM